MTLAGKTLFISGIGLAIAQPQADLFVDHT
jgi:hypothetical protein